MSPPPIRYPLPTLIASAALILILWRGEVWSRPLRSAAWKQWERATAGPEVPHSNSPQAVLGGLTRRVLLLKDDLPATDKPDGRVIQTIRRRMFAEVFDAWPIGKNETPTHFRIGNHRAIGWVRAPEVLDWTTRLVVRPSGRVWDASISGDVPLPVLSASDKSIRIAAWDRDHPWASVAKILTIDRSQVSSESWGVLLSRQELLTLLGPPPPNLRAKAIAGSLLDPSPMPDSELHSIRPMVPEGPDPSLTESARIEALSRINELASPDASWGGIPFLFVPLSLITDEAGPRERIAK